MTLSNRAQQSIVRLLVQSRSGVYTQHSFKPGSACRFVHSSYKTTSVVRSLLPAFKADGCRLSFQSRRSYTNSPSLPDAAQSEQTNQKEKKEETPAYEMTFTCKVCQTRSTHRVSKQGYHNGTVLIQCPGCKNRHLIADHLKVFSDTSITLEDIMKEKGQLVQRGTLDEDGDLELWEDGTSNPRQTTSSKTASAQHDPATKKT